jgi:hypothetical protein
VEILEVTQAELKDMFKEACKSVCMSIVAVLHNTLSPTPSTYSATQTYGPHSPGPSAYLIEFEETPQNTEGDHDTPEPADEGDIQMEYSSD